MSPQYRVDRTAGYATIARLMGAIAMLWATPAAGHPTHRHPEADPLEDTPAPATLRPDSPLRPRSPGVSEPDELMDSAGEATAEDTGLGFAPVAGVTYSNETSAMFGTAAVLFYKPPFTERRISQVTLAVAYSVRAQLVATAYADLFGFDDRVSVHAALNFLYYPDSFFGIGSDTQISDEERFVPRNLEARLRPLYQIIDDVFVGPVMRLESISVLETQSGGRLASGEVFGADGGFDFSFGIAAVYDTRDNTLYPRRGSSFEFWTLVSDPVLGSDFRMSRSLVDLRHYIPLGPPDHVLALQGVGRFTTGTVPFFALGRLGGERLLRGHFNGRFRDGQLLALQGEYRFPLVWRLGMVGFAGVGNVAPRLRSFRLRDSKYGVGAGLRLNLAKKERIHLRADLAWGGDEAGAYVNVGEAF